MEALEKRQAARVVRNAKTAERELFMLTDDLQEAREPDMLPYDWQCARGGLQLAMERVQICLALVDNTIAELGRVEGGVS